jgi:hypothetical protein
MVAAVVYLVNYGMAHRALWLWIGGLLTVLSLGSSRAHSLPEFLIGGSINLLGLLIAVGIIALFFRDNVLAYVSAAFCLPLAEPLASLFAQPAAFFRLNGLLLTCLVFIALGWMFLKGGGSSTPRTTTDESQP